MPSCAMVKAALFVEPDRIVLDDQPLSDVGRRHRADIVIDAQVIQATFKAWLRGGKQRMRRLTPGGSS